jgi:DeoR family transcriptional regulator, glycerol-3-phosphate regulon repressor
MRALSNRQNEILARARELGRVDVEELSQEYGVSPQTIRKDLKDLCDRHVLQRVHGGAVIVSGIENVGYELRRVLAPEAKQAIGHKAASLIPDNCSLFINIGTTTEQVAKALQQHRGLLVITNNLNVAEILRPALGVELIVAGGLVRQSDGGIIGEAAVDFISQFKVDYAVIGASAIDEDGALLDYDFREVSVSKAIIANARHVMLVADLMKQERTAPVRIGHVAQVDTFVTDQEPSSQFREICAANDVQIVVAD